MKNLLCVAIMLFVVSTVSAVVPIVIDDDGDRDTVAGPNVTAVDMSSHDNGGWGVNDNAFNDTVAFNETADGNATYTFDAGLGLIAGETYDVYAYWYVGTHNAGDAIYTVSDGLGAVAVDQTVVPAADLMITDPDPEENNTLGTELGFKLLGQVTEDGDGIITITISKGTSTFFVADAVAVALPILASGFDPCDGWDTVPVDRNLTWELDASVTNCDVYFGTDPNMANNPKVVNGVHQESYDPDLDNDTTYYWRVDARIGTTVYEGDVLEFTTVTAGPVITEDPCGLTVEAGETAVFRVVATNVDTYLWKKLDGSALSDNTGPTLTITDVQKANEGVYWCELKKGTIPVDTAKVNLMTRRLVARWEFEDNLNDVGTGDWPGACVDPNYVLDDPCTTGSGKSLQLFDDPRHVLITGSEDFFNFYPQGYTVNTWIKSMQSSSWGCLAGKQLEADDIGWGVHYSDGKIWTGLRGVSSVYNNASIDDNEWHMVAVTYDAEDGVLTAYVDGESVGSDTDTGVALTNIYPVLLGTEQTDGLAGNYEGLLDSVSIYSYGLGPIDVATLYTNMVGGELCIGGNPDGDLNDDCKVDIEDFAMLAGDWLECNIVPTCLP